MYFSKVAYVNAIHTEVLCKVPRVFHTTCKRCGQGDPPLYAVKIRYGAILHTQGTLAKVPHVNVALLFAHMQCRHFALRNGHDANVLCVYMHKPTYKLDKID